MAKFPSADFPIRSRFIVLMRVFATLRLSNEPFRAVEYGMILIRFPDEGAKDKDSQMLLGEYPIRSWRSGELLLPEEALPLLARKNMLFTFEGVEAYERISAVQYKILPQRRPRRFSHSREDIYLYTSAVHHCQLPRRRRSDF